MSGKLVAIVGATASGKTALGEYLALKFGGEIISADAKQVYRGMDIGTAKELDLRVKQHVLDIKEPGERITVAEFQRLAYEAIDGCLARGVRPFIVGGSGLYVEAVTEGYLFGGRGEKRKEPRYDVLTIGIQRDRQELKERARGRIQVWLDQGLLEEIERLLAQGVSPAWLDACGLEYRHFSRYLRDEVSMDEAKEATFRETKDLIKRQLTWWRRHPDVHWVSDNAEAEALVAYFFSNHGA